MQTEYGVWKPADGLFKEDETEKVIHFISSSDTKGFVRVVGGEAGYTNEDGKEPKQFTVPKGAKCEVLGCKIMFTRD